MIERRLPFLVLTLGLTLVLAAFLPTATLTAATITGEVVDRTDGQPLLGATVTIKSDDGLIPTARTASDRTGRYKISDLPLGAYTVFVSFVGYSSDSREAQVTNQEDTLTVDIALIPRAIDLNTISVTASRRPEKINDAPASVSVVGSDEIAERSTLSPTEHLKGLPAVDVASTGLNQSNVVTRGFNNIFSGALLVLADNRLARVPSLRFNAYNFISMANDDIERIEVVSGPGSALYGPNSAAGVMHLVSRSPFDSKGTTISFGGGERDLMMGSIRHAGTINHRVGYKITGQYYEGNDWEHTEPTEPAKVVLFRPTPDGPVFEGDSVDNSRDYKTEKLSVEGRLDFLLSEDASLIFNGGYNKGTGIELTGLSAGQAIDWGYSYFQSRFRYKDLFVQGYVNGSDAGDTYLLNTGSLIVDKSKIWVAQLQHSYRANDRWFFTYGADAFFTRPSTEATINGRNEEDDNINEAGVYFQAEAKIDDKLKFVGAARLDDHNRLEDKVFSPRAALVYQPDLNNSLRFTYNRAYSTPDNNNLYLDILQSVDPFHTGIDVRVQGVPETGFSWRLDSGGDPMFRSQLSPLIMQDPSTYYPQGTLTPQLTAAAWGVGVQLARGQLLQTLIGGGMDPATATGLADAVAGLAPGAISPQTTITRVLDLDTQTPVEVNAADYVDDIDRLEPAITQTFEMGYKGVLGDRIRFSVDAYRTKKHNFVGPLTVETPNVFMNIDPALGLEVEPQVGIAFAGLDPATQATLTAILDGNDSGSPVDEITTMLLTGAGQTALGTITPDEALNPTDVLVTYRNFGDIVYYGIDLSFAYHLNHYWNVGGSYSYISKNFFERDDDQVHDIRLNAPRNKAGVYLQFNHPKRALAAGARVRYVDAFDMDSPFFGSRVDSYVLADLNAGIDIVPNTRFTITVQNIFDNMHTEFIGGAEMGRLAIARITQNF